MARDSGAGAQVKVTSILGSNETQVPSQRIRGGRILVLLGNGEVDLSNATLADGEAEIRILAVFGSVKVTVPEDWSVNVQTGTVFGRVDYRPAKRPVATPSMNLLTLKGACLFGGVEIRS